MRLLKERYGTERVYQEMKGELNDGPSDVPNTLRALEGDPAQSCF